MTTPLDWWGDEKPTDADRAHADRVLRIAAADAPWLCTTPEKLSVTRVAAAFASVRQLAREPFLELAAELDRVDELFDVADRIRKAAGR